MRIDDAADGRAMAVIVNHACHATTLGGDNLQLTPDYPGYARAAVKAGLPDHPTVLFLNGACGDVNPGGYSAEASALGKFIPNRTFERAEAIGRTIGAEVVRLATSLGTEGRVCVQGGARTLRLPLKALPTPAEAEAELRKAVARLASARRAALPEAQIDRAAMDLIYAQTHADQSRRLSGSPNGELASDIQGIAVGDILFLGLPGEVFTEIGLTLKRSSGFAHTFIVAYANDSAGYIPTAEALRGGDGYEVIVSVLGPAAIDRFIEGAVSLAGEIRERMR
jgi:hypothetical protein